MRPRSLGTTESASTSFDVYSSFQVTSSVTALRCTDAARSSSELNTFYGRCPSSASQTAAALPWSQPARSPQLQTLHPGKEVCAAIQRPTRKCQVSERKIGAAQEIHSCVQCWINWLRKMIPRMERMSMLLTSMSQLRIPLCHTVSIVTDSAETQWRRL